MLGALGWIHYRLIGYIIPPSTVWASFECCEPTHQCVVTFFERCKQSSTIFLCIQMLKKISHTASTLWQGALINDQRVQTWVFPKKHIAHHQLLNLFPLHGSDSLTMAPTQATLAPYLIPTKQHHCAMTCEGPIIIQSGEFFRSPIQISVDLPLRDLKVFVKVLE